MDIERHCRRSEELFGEKGRDIHRWIDAFFDTKRYFRSRRHYFRDGFDPFSHRRKRHFREALAEALQAFEGRYPPDLIEKIFLQHLRDDYEGYLPERKDFDDPEFQAKYHHGKW